MIMKRKIMASRQKVLNKSVTLMGLFCVGLGGAASLSMLQSCGDDNSNEKRDGAQENHLCIVGGKVMDGSKPAKDIVVEFAGYSAVTKEDGLFTFVISDKSKCAADAKIVIKNKQGEELNSRTVGTNQDLSNDRFISMNNVLSSSGYGVESDYMIALPYAIPPVDDKEDSTLDE